MRKIVLLLTMTAALGFAAAPASAAKDQGRPVLNVGHRGASGHAPEHTIPAYDLAIRQGADYIEQDIRITKDGVLVPLHDETLDRTARGPAENCTGPVSDKTLAQLKTCDMGLAFGPEWAGLRIPTLEEIFRRYGTRANYYIETKSFEQPTGIEEPLLALIDRYGLTEPAAQRWQVLIQSFLPNSLLKIHALDPSLPLIQLYPEGLAVAPSLEVARTYSVGVGPAASDVDSALVQAAHARCLSVHPWTVDEPTEMTRMIGLGVDGMFTDFPDRLDAVLGRRALPAKTAAARASENSRSCRG